MQVLNEELIRDCVQLLKLKFAAWRDPPVELPAESVIHEVVKEIIERTVHEIRA